MENNGSYTLDGTIFAIFETRQVSATFRTREFVVEFISNPQFQRPEYVKFELNQDKVDLIDNFNEGDQVRVSFNLSGREWVNPKGERVYFNSLKVWRIAAADAAPAGRPAAARREEDDPFGPPPPRPAAKSAPAEDYSDEVDDLPF